MKLSERLSVDAVCVNLESGERDVVIAELVKRLASHPDVVDPGAFLDAVYEREKQSGTGIGRGVAIPHARTDSVKDFVIAVGRSTSGIAFDAIDEEPVHLVILMGTPPERVKNYLKLLAHLSLLLKQKGFIESLLGARDAQGIVDVFQRHEE